MIRENDADFFHSGASFMLPLMAITFVLLFFLLRKSKPKHIAPPTWESYMMLIEKLLKRYQKLRARGKSLEKNCPEEIEQFTKDLEYLAPNSLGEFCTEGSPSEKIQLYYSKLENKMHISKQLELKLNELTRKNYWDGFYSLKDILIELNWLKMSNETRIYKSGVERLKKIEQWNSNVESVTSPLPGIYI